MHGMVMHISQSTHRGILIGNSAAGLFGDGDQERHEAMVSEDDIQNVFKGLIVRSNKLRI